MINRFKTTVTISSSSKERGRLVYRFLNLKHLAEKINKERPLIIENDGDSITIPVVKLDKNLFSRFKQVYSSKFEEWSDNQLSDVELDLKHLERDNKLIIKSIRPRV